MFNAGASYPNCHYPYWPLDASSAKTWKHKCFNIITKILSVSLIFRENQGHLGNVAIV